MIHVPDHRRRPDASTNFKGVNVMLPTLRRQSVQPAEQYTNRSITLSDYNGRLLHTIHARTADPTEQFVALFRARSSDQSAIVKAGAFAPAEPPSSVA